MGRAPKAKRHKLEWASDGKDGVVRCIYCGVHWCPEDDYEGYASLSLATVEGGYRVCYARKDATDA